jgi:hypothetical protein
MNVQTRRVIAMLGGAIFGFCLGAGATTIAHASSESGLIAAAVVGGLGLGAMAAAIVRE